MIMTKISVWTETCQFYYYALMDKVLIEDNQINMSNNFHLIKYAFIEILNTGFNTEFDNCQTITLNDCFTIYKDDQIKI